MDNRQNQKPQANKPIPPQHAIRSATDPGPTLQAPNPTGNPAPTQVTPQALASARGELVDLLQKQLKMGKPLTIPQTEKVIEIIISLIDKISEVPM